MKMMLRKPLFIFLLPIFFYLFGCTSYGNYVSWNDLLMPSLLFVVVVTLLQYVTKVLFKSNQQQANICLFILLLVYSFFGIFKHALSTVANLPFISTYKFMLIFTMLFVVALYYLLKRKKEVSTLVFQYCNYLMMLLCIMQCVMILISARPKEGATKIAFNQTSMPDKKPNIYMILLDEYAGHRSLQDYFHYSNDSIQLYLKSIGYYVADSMNSNYNLTVASQNATLNMQYPNLQALQPFNQYQFYLNSMLQIKHNQLSAFMYDAGYEINNLSLFDLDHAASKASFTSLKKGIDLIHAPFFHEELYKDWCWILCMGKYKMDYFYSNIVLKNHIQNNDLIKATLAISKQKKATPQFTYTHLLLPHEPYFTDSSGHLYQEDVTDTLSIEKKYVGYLKYANTRIKEIANKLQQQDPSAIVVIYSDHGYRDYPLELKSLSLNNFFAIYLPDQQYESFKKVHSNVNIFRVLLNQYFNQQLPLMEDRHYIIDETNNTFSLLQSKQ